MVTEGGCRGSSQAGVPRRVAPPLAVLAGHRAPHQCRRRARAGRGGRRSADGERVPAFRGGPRLRQHRLRHQAGARQSPICPGWPRPRSCILPDAGNPTCDCAHPINGNDFGVAVVSGRGRSPFTLVSGQLPDPSKPDQVLASSTLQQDYGVHVGSRDPRPLRGTLAGRRLQQPQHGDSPTRTVPTSRLHVVGIEATEVEFPSGIHPRLPPVRRSRVRALGAPAHGGGIPVLRPPAPRCGRHPPVRRTAQDTEPGHRHRRRLERGRNGRHDPGVHPPPGRRVVDPRRARRARRAGGRGPGAGPPERRRERGPPDPGRRRHVRPAALRARHGTEPGRGPGRRRGRRRARHGVVPHRSPRRGTTGRGLHRLRVRLVRAPARSAGDRGGRPRAWHLAGPAGRAHPASTSGARPARPSVVVRHLVSPGRAASPR